MDSAPPVQPAAAADTVKKRDSRGTSAAATAWLDLLRFTAANLVLLSHIFVVFFDNKKTYEGRGVAVIILFVLSGFLITRSLMYRAKKPGEHMPEFLADRVARIMTPFVPVLLMIALLNATVIHTHWSLPGLSTGFAALLGNLFLLFDYPLFQFLEIAHVDMWWRIRPYNTAEPFWTVAIEFWIYIAMSLLFFVAIKRERIRTGWIVVLALISVPVIIWNAADGAGKALSLTWLVGGMAGFLVVFMGSDSAAARSKLLAWIIVGCGIAALGARIVKHGFDPYDLQTNFLMTVIFFGVFLRLNQATIAWKLPTALAKFGASYSYSLYLVHNTVLVIVFENTHSWPKPYAIAFGVVLAHLVALLVYHLFEKHHRAVGTYLRPIFSRTLLKSKAQAAPPPIAAPAGLVVASAAETKPELNAPALES